MVQRTTSTSGSRRFGRRDRRSQLDEVHRLLVRIEAALVVRDPGTARSVDAYDGLRKQVIAAASERRRLLVMLSELAEALRLGQSVEVLRSKADEWMLQANLVELRNAEADDAFEVVGSGTGSLRVVVPAYVDAATGVLVRRGVAERSDDAAAPEGVVRTVTPSNTEISAGANASSELEPPADGDSW